MDADGWRLTEGDEIAPGRRAVRLLGGGRRYEAYLAWDDELRTLVVAKLLRPALLDDAAARAGLEREADLLASLAHPALVRSFGAQLDGMRPHVVLEHLDGPRLSTLVRRHGIVLEQLLPLALEVCSALHYLSRRAVVHLDVKPRNIIMSAPPRLIDLSVATRVSDLGRIVSPVGTDAYMAPEQCDPGRFERIGPPSDVWGLGVTLYESVAARVPFPGGVDDPDAPAATRFPQLAAAPDPLPRDVPGALAETIFACIAERPEDRPTAAKLAETLEPVVAELPRARLGLFRPGGRVRSSVFEAG